MQSKKWTREVNAIFCDMLYTLQVWGEVTVSWQNNEQRKNLNCENLKVSQKFSSPIINICITQEDEFTF